MIEETLLNMMLNPESLETAGDLIRKIEQDLFKTSNQEYIIYWFRYCPIVESDWCPDSLR